MAAAARAAAAAVERSTAKADKCVRIFFFLLRLRRHEAIAAGAPMMVTLETAALLAEWAVVAVCAAIAVAWLVKELLMGVCVIDKRLDGKVVIVTGERERGGQISNSQP